MTRPLVVRAAFLASFIALGSLLGGLLLASLETSAWWELLFILTVILVGGSAGWLAFMRPAASLDEVSGAASELATGDLGRRVASAGGPTRELTANFNSMSIRLEGLFETVAAEHARLEAVFAAATDA